MSSVNYVVRDSAGSARRGSFVEGDPSSIYVSFTKDVSLNLSAGEIASYTRSGDDLIIELKDGQTLVLSGFYDTGSTGEKNLFLSEQGEIVEVVLEGEGDGNLVPSYQAASSGEKWSPTDELVFLDLAEVQPVVAPLAAPLIGPLGAMLGGGAAIAGGAAILGGGDDGGPGIIQPTVNDPDATHVVGGTEADSVTVSGTGAAGSEVLVDIGGQTQTVIVDDDGVWTATFDIAGLPGDGIYESTVSVVDPKGNTFDLDGPTVDIDVTAPLIEVVSGTEATGDLVNAASHDDGATITGTGEAGASVDVTIGGKTHSTVVDEDGNWSVTFATSEITTGEYNTAISIVTTDARGNSTTMSDVLVVDTVAPTADLGVVEGDDVVNAAEASDGVTLDGAGEPGATVEVTFQGVTRTTTVDAGGSWSVNFAASEIAAGTYDSTVSITTTDAAGNSSTSSHSIHVDTEQNLSMNAEVGGDHVISAAEQAAGVTFTGTAEAGSSVVVSMGDVSHTVTAGADGTWSATFAPGDIPTGTYETTVTAVATDSAGNSETTSQTIRVDTEATVALDPDQAGDNVISGAEAAEGVNLTGTAEPGSSVDVTMQGVTHTVTAGADGTWSAAFASGEIPAGEYDAEVSVSATDTVGNTSTTTGTVRVDTQTNVSIGAGQAGGDDLISAAEQAAGVSFTGTAEPGAGVVVTMGTVSHTVTAGAAGTWSATFAPGDIPTGTYETTLTAVATDSAGNSETTSQSVRVDTENTVALDPTQAGDNVISGAEAAAGVTLTGTAEAGARVDVTMQGVTHTVTAGADGTWSAAFSAADIPAGEYDAQVSVSATDAAGNTSTTTGMVRVDTQTSVGIDPAQAGGDNLISGAEQASGVSFTGTAEPGSSVVVSMGSASHTVTTGANGTWSATFAPGDIPTGTYETTLTAVATDSAGNSETTSQSVRVDTENTVALDPTQAGDNVISGAEAAAGVALTGTAEPGSSVDVTMQGVTHSVTAGANGTWSATFSAVDIPPGEYDAQVLVSATDAAGNTATTTGTVHVDTQTNVSIDPGPAGGDSIVNAAEAQAGVTFTGAAEPGASVQVTVAGVTLPATVDGSGNWSVLYASGSLPNGEYDTTIQVNATDAAGNTASSSSSIRVDTTAGEVALSPLPIEIDDVINAAERADGVVINGTATPGLTVTVGLGGATQQVVADAGGNWSVTVPASSIPTGTQTLPITASITDPAGNTASVSDSVLLDTVVDNYNANLDAIEGDDIINAAERADGVTLTGSVEPGSTVVVQLGAVTQAASVDGAGNWTVTFAAASIPEGTYTSDITVTATDAAGNTAVINDTVQVDTEVQATVAPDQTADDIVNAVEQAAGLTLTGTAEPGSSVLVDLMGTQRIATVDALGNWSAAFEPADVPLGTYSATATITATDPAGNVATLTETFDVDTEIDSPNVDSVTFSGSDVWRIGTQDAEGDYSVNTLDPNGVVGSPASTVSQHPVLGTEFTFSSPVPDGTNLVVSRVDAAGNESATLTVLEDGAGSATTVGHAGLGSFDIQALNLDYGENTNIVLNEAQIRQLSDSSDTLTIHGGADDTITVAGAVNTGQSQQHDGQAYNVYTLGNDGTTLLIEQDINVII